MQTITTEQAVLNVMRTLPLQAAQSKTPSPAPLTKVLSAARPEPIQPHVEPHHEIRAKVVSLLKLCGSLESKDLELMLRDEGFSTVKWQRHARKAGAKARQRTFGAAWEWKIEDYTLANKYLPVEQPKTCPTCHRVMGGCQ